jgi:nucleoside-diphosphate-sugar epimerase
MEPLREPEDPLTPPFNPEPESLSILITGGTGCVGIAIAKAILTRHPTALIHVLDLNVPAKDSTDTDWRAVPGVAEYFPVDITDEVGLRNAFDRVRPRVVIHAASLIPFAAKKLSFGDEGVLKVNVEGTRIVLQVAKQVGTVEALVYTGCSDAVKRDSWENFENYTEEQEEKRREASTEPEKWDEVYAKSKVSISLGQTKENRFQSHLANAQEIDLHIYKTI